MVSVDTLLDVGIGRYPGIGLRGGEGRWWKRLSDSKTHGPANRVRQSAGLTPADDESETVHLDDGPGERLRSFLRQAVPAYSVAEYQQDQ